MVDLHDVARAGAERISDALDRLPADLVELLGDHLRVEDGVLGEVGLAIWGIGRTPKLGRLRLTRALSSAARDPATDELVDGLAGTVDEPWPTIREALRDARAAGRVAFPVAGRANGRVVRR